MHIRKESMEAWKVFQMACLLKELVVYVNCLNEHTFKVKHEISLVISFNSFFDELI